MPLTAPLLTDTKLDRQIALEERAIQEGIARYRKLASDAIRRGDGAGLKPAERLLAHWFEVVAGKVKDEQDAVRRGDPGVGRCVAGPVLRMLPPEVLAIIAMHETVGACMVNPGGAPVTQVSNAIGRAVFAEINLRLASAERREVARKIKAGEIDEEDGKRERHRLDINSRFRRFSVKKANWWARKTLTEPLRDRSACVSTGSVLLDIVVNHAWASSYENSFVPSFVWETIARNNKKLNIVRFTEEIREVIRKGHVARQFLRPCYLPMIVRPYKWMDGAQGGYVSIRTPLVSKPTPRQKKAIAAANMDRVFDGLDAVAGTAWCIDREIAEIQQAVWEQGGGRLGLPHAGDREFPVRPADIDTNPEAKRAWKRAATKVHRENIQRASDRSSFDQMMQLVEMFKDEPELFYPHQLDYRGRAYPIPQHLNHQCDDVRRGILHFAEAKPVDDEAMDEIRIEAANCWGNDKVPFHERIQWTRDHERDIRLSADDPLSTDWWHKADEPWQFLAACRALHDPEKAARLAVGRDGSCNGLQWYAAIGRDEEAAKWVNLIPHDRPRDVYTKVCEEAHKILASRTDPLASELATYLDRKVAKQPVMTRAGYGAKDVGLQRQIADSLEDKWFPRERAFKAAIYLREVIVEAIGQTCRSASEIMEWFRLCATNITKSGEDVRWTNPIGMPVVQPHRKFDSHRLRIRRGSLKILCDNDSGVDVQEQVDACPPNVIHSFDASMMFMVAIRCRDAGLAAAACHDKFVTHAATRRVQDRIIREEFVAIAEKPLLTMLRDEWRRNCPSVEIPDHPTIGALNIREVLDSPYAFA